MPPVIASTTVVFAAVIVTTTVAWIALRILRAAGARRASARAEAILHNPILQGLGTEDWKA